MNFLKYYFLNEVSDAVLNKVKNKFIMAGDDKDDVNKLVDKFQDLSLRNRLPKGIDLMSFKTLDALRQELSKVSEKSKSDIKKITKIEGANKVFENDKVTVIVPDTEKASCAYGAGTKWCTAATESKNYFNTYHIKGIKIYYIIPKDDSGKIALAVYPKNKMTEAFDQEDHSVDIDDFRIIIKNFGINKSIFIPYTDEEIKIIQENLTKKWMKEDLNVTTFNDGTPIPLVEDNEKWVNLETPAMCYYDNNPSDGALYNGYAIRTGKLAPIGFHIPTHEEWQEIENPEQINLHLRGCNSNGGYMLYGENGYYWSSTPQNPINLIARIVHPDEGLYDFQGYNNDGYSVRCIRD